MGEIGKTIGKTEEKFESDEKRRSVYAEIERELGRV
jgi:hypothetical protein